MSDSEEENYCYFGRPLEPYDEDAFPKKKPISVEEQIATDAQGRRRFHGAFTGGFSAGFYNTVGSLEGWTPSEFKSTRQDKGQSKTQRPEDFMDDEDISEFGIAPQTVRATSDYSTSKKRKKKVFSDGPIPGEPVLHSLLSSGNETIGYLLLKNIGLKDKNKGPATEETTEGRVYGCEMPKTYEISRDDEVNQYVIPDLYKEFLQKPKDNSFGLGYEGLDKSHINLFQSSKLVIRERNNKKVSISGQAFGVGAFEDDDEDIYVKEDMSRYDFELTSEKQSKKESLSLQDKTIFGDFIASRTTLEPREIFLPPTIPHSFTGKHKIRKSRFEPLPEPILPERKVMNPEVRARYLGEEITPGPETPIKVPEPTRKTEEKEQNLKEENKPKPFDLFSVSATDLVFDRFVSASKPEDPSNILEAVEKSETEHGTQEMRAAAKMKMFGPLTRITEDWQPCSLLCKRFNVPEPHCELDASKNRKRTKNLIFEYSQFADETAELKPGLSGSKGTPESSKIDSVDNSAVEDSIMEDRVSTPTQPSNTASDVTDAVLNVIPETEEKTVEVPKDITEKIDVNKNIDLFKAVFLSSSESEGEEETEKEKTDRNTELKTTVLSDSLLPKIKPLKEGILSNMDFLVFEKPDSSKAKTSETTEPISTTNVVQPINELSYGPALPIKLTNPTNTKVNNKAAKCRSDDDSDEWVEKSEDRKSKSSHKKKHKNKKSSHKKKHKRSKD